MKLDVTGRLPGEAELSRDRLKRAAAFFAMRSSRRVPELGRWHGVEIHLVDDAGSDGAHRAIMGIEGATDVITQAYSAIPPEAPGIYGELFVNAVWAVRHAPKRAGWSAAKELLLYIAHGMDHLSGANDYDAADYRRMRRRELGWIRDFLKGEADR
jgi:rRNA maturation RNase YbeY